MHNFCSIALYKLFSRHKNIQNSQNWRTFLHPFFSKSRRDFIQIFPCQIESLIKHRQFRLHLVNDFKRLALIFIDNTPKQKGPLKRSLKMA